MKTIFKKGLMVTVSLSILNVWLLRFGQASGFRGGSATDMLSEFAAYGLDATVMYGVGTIKVLAAITLLLGIRYSKLVFPALCTITVFMMAAIYFHVAIHDAWIKSLPAAFLLSASIVLLVWHRKELSALSSTTHTV